jgi:hypothetical protein
LSPSISVSTGADKLLEVVLKGMASNLVKLGPTFTPTVSNNLKTTYEILYIFPCEVPSLSPPSILIVCKMLS